MTKPAGLYWARIDHDGTGPSDEITVVEIDGDGDVYAIAIEDPLDPARVVLLGLAAPPAGLTKAPPP